MNYYLMLRLNDDNHFRWLECYDFISDKVYYLSLNSDGKIKLKDSIVKSLNINTYFNANNKVNKILSVESITIPINKKQMEDLMNLDNYSLMKMDKFEFAKKYNLEQAFI